MTKKIINITRRQHLYIRSNDTDITTGNVHTICNLNLRTLTWKPVEGIEIIFAPCSSLSITSNLSTGIDEKLLPLSHLLSIVHNDEVAILSNKEEKFDIITYELYSSEKGEVSLNRIELPTEYFKPLETGQIVKIQDPPESDENYEAYKELAKILPNKSVEYNSFEES